MQESRRDYQPTSHDEQAMLDRAQHTPGPWQAVSDTLVRGPHGEAVAMTRTRDTYPFDLNHAANARLIAAAPDLLAALEEIASVFWSDHEDCRYCDAPEGDDHDPDALCGVTLAAIRNARGQ